MKTYDQITCKRLLDRFEDLSKKLYSANAEITVLRNLKNVTDEGYRKLLGERGELQDKLKISEDFLSRLKEITYSESENGRDCIVLIEEALKQIRGEG